MPRGQVGAAAWGGHLYVVAGCGVQGAGDCLSVGDLSVGDFFPDGGVGNFRSAGSLPGSGEAAELAVVVVNGTLLVTGGIIGYGPARKDVLRARLDPVTGMPSALTATTALPETPGLLGHALLAHRGFLYTVGGQTNTEYGPYSDRVLAARLSSDGTVGAWSTVARLPEARGSVSAVLFDDTIYAVMGCNETTSSYCGTFVRAMVAAPVLDDGGVGPFTPVTNHPNPRRNAAVAVLGGRLVTAGGYDGNPEDFVEASTLYGRGRLGAASLLPPAPAGKVAFASAAGHLYAFGADGSVHTALPGGAWEAVTSLPEVAAASSSNGVLYAVSSTQLYRSGAPDVSWAAGAPLPRTVVKPALAGPYLADGTDVFANLGGAWQTAPALPCGAEALALAGQLLFAFCGDTGDVLVSSLAISGAPGDWRRAEGLPGPRHGFGVTFSDGVLYVAGGEAVDVLASVVHSDGTLGPWAIATTLGGPRAPSSLLSVGGRLVSSSAAELVAWPKWTAPSRGVVSARVDLGSGVNLIEGLTLQGSGEVEVDLRLAKDDGAFGEWVPLGRTRLGSELVIGKSAHFVWLRITLLDDARITSGIISTRL
ncbi:MAG: hypothetical protein IPJ65_24990 [Archangiaceae bacterium]|nr:hypothetical protein [Archangiaceae bacterium]